MKAFASLLSVAAIATALTACGRMADTHDADVQAIRDNEAQWNKDYAAKDVDKVMAHYASDAVLMTPGIEPAWGKDAIQKSTQQLIADPALSLTFKPAKIVVAKSGDLAFTQGIYNLTATDPGTKKVINDHGSYVTTYRKLPDDGWKAISDIATSAVPASPPPAPAAKKAVVKRTAAKRKHR